MSAVEGGSPSNSAPASDYGAKFQNAVQDRWSNKTTADAFYHNMQDALQHLSPSDLKKALSNTDIDHLADDIGTNHGLTDKGQLTADQEAYLFGQLAKAGPDGERVQTRVRELKEKQANLLDQVVRGTLGSTQETIAGHSTITDLEAKKQAYLGLKGSHEPQAKIDQALDDYHAAAIKGLHDVRQSAAKESAALDGHIKNLDRGLEAAYFARDGSIAVGAMFIPGAQGVSLAEGAAGVALLGGGQTAAQWVDGEIGTLGSAGKAVAKNTANAAANALAGYGYKVLGGAMGLATNMTQKGLLIGGAGGLNAASGAAHRLIAGEKALDPNQGAVDAATGMASFGVIAKLAPVMSQSPVVHHTVNTAVGAATGAATQAAGNLANGHPVGENVGGATLQSAAIGLVSGIAMSPSDPAYAQQALEPNGSRAMRTEMQGVDGGGAVVRSVLHEVPSTESPAAPSVRFRFVYDGNEWSQETPAELGPAATPWPDGQVAATARVAAEAAPTVQVEDPLSGDIVTAKTRPGMMQRLSSLLDPSGILSQDHIRQSVSQDADGKITTSEQDKGSLCLIRNPDGTYDIVPSIGGGSGADDAAPPAPEGDEASGLRENPQDALRVRPKDERRAEVLRLGFEQDWIEANRWILDSEDLIKKVAILVRALGKDEAQEIIQEAPRFQNFSAVRLSKAAPLYKGLRIRVPTNLASIAGYPDYALAAVTADPATRTYSTYEELARALARAKANLPSGGRQKPNVSPERLAALKVERSEDRLAAWREIARQFDIPQEWIEEHREALVKSDYGRVNYKIESLRKGGLTDPEIKRLIMVPQRLAHDAIFLKRIAGILAKIENWRLIDFDTLATLRAGNARDELIAALEEAKPTTREALKLDRVLYRKLPATPAASDRLPTKAVSIPQQETHQDLLLGSVKVLVQQARSIKEPLSKDVLLEAIEKLLDQPTTIPQRETVKVLVQQARSIKEPLSKDVLLEAIEKLLNQP